MVEARDALQARILELNPDWTSTAARMAPDGDADLPGDTVDRFGVPACASCGGVLKPRVVFFGDSVPRPVVDEALAAVDGAEVLLVVGSSLAVYSGYRFLRRAVERGIPVAIVNRGPVRGEEQATVKVEASTGTVLHALVAAVT